MMMGPAPAHRSSTSSSYSWRSSDARSSALTGADRMLAATVSPGTGFGSARAEHRWKR